MPELPEVETLARQFAKILPGKTIKKIHTAPSLVFKTDRLIIEKKVSGMKISGIKRRGKFFGIQLEHSLDLWIHLGMTGSLIFRETSWPENDPHVHLRFQFKDDNSIFIFRDPRRFGRVFLWEDQSNSNPRTLLSRLGPEPFELDANSFFKLFERRNGRIKNLLLNQEILAGIGNIYADESLFRANLNPRKKPLRIGFEHLSRLHEALCKVLTEAIQLGGSSIDDYVHYNGSQGKFQNRHQVYGREGKPCHQCRSRIRRIVLGGRSSFFCPQCQK